MLTMSAQKNLARAKAIFDQGNIQKQEGRLNESISSYRQAMQIQPNYTEPILKLAEIYEDQKNWTEAAECYQKMITLKPKRTFIRSPGII